MCRVRWPRRLELQEVERQRAAVLDVAERAVVRQVVLDRTLPRDSVYFLTVSDANDFGGGQYGYRLVVR